MSIFFVIVMLLNVMLFFEFDVVIGLYECICSFLECIESECEVFVEFVEDFWVVDFFSFMIFWIYGGIECSFFELLMFFE